jgi:hypothetical protein
VLSGNLMSMQARVELTRRGLVRAAAGAAGASLLQRVPAAMAASPPVHRVRIAGLPAGSSGWRLAPMPFGLIGAQWSAPFGTRVELRVEHADGRRSRWFDTTPRHGGVAEPIWTGSSRYFELRASAPLADVTVHLVGVARSAPPMAGLAAAAGLPQYEAGPGQPSIIPRAAWATPACNPKRPPGFGEIALAFVHHTQGVNSYGPHDSPAIVQSICLFHQNANGWNDIGYNFLVDRYGQIFEGRFGGIDQPVGGAQAGGFNFVSTGVSVIGDFMAESPPPEALQALQRLLAWKLSLHGVPTTGRTRVRVSRSGASYTAFPPDALVSLQRVSGHRDGDQTDCPGDALYGDLDAVRQQVTALAGPTNELTLVVAPSTGARLSAAAPATVSGVLRQVGGAPIANAPIEIQQRRGTAVVVVALAVTGPDGSWSVPLRVKEDRTLRAVHRGKPAVISHAVPVAVAPELTLTLTPGPVPVAQTVPGRILVTGSSRPAKRAVTINLYAVSGTQTKLISRTRLRRARGTFQASIRVPGPGTYLLSAHTPADARNAAGVSVPIAVTL